MVGILAGTHGQLRRALFIETAPGVPAVPGRVGRPRQTLRLPACGEGPVQGQDGGCRSRCRDVPPRLFQNRGL